MNSEQMKNKMAALKEDVKEKNKNIGVDVLLSGAFFILAALASAIILSGYGFSVETFLDVKFYASTAISFAIMMFTYNFGKRIFLMKMKKAKGSDYFTNKEREAKLVKQVRDEHLEWLIEEESKVETDNRRKEAAQVVLSNATYGLLLQDIENLDNSENIAINKEKFDEFVKKRHLNKKEIKKLKQSIKNVLNGKYYYEKITSKDVLIDSSANRFVEKKIKINERIMDLNENKAKAIMFLITTAITNSLIWNGINGQFWSSLLNQVVLILSSLISAILVANTRLSTLTIVCENKCDFLNIALSKKQYYLDKLEKEKQLELAAQKQVEIEKEKLIVKEVLLDVPRKDLLNESPIVEYKPSTETLPIKMPTPETESTTINPILDYDPFE